MCSAEHHAHLASHEWSRLIPLGTMSGVELANCPDCPDGERFTFSRPLPVIRWWANRRHDCIRVETTDGHQTVYELDGDRIVDFDDEVFARAVFAEWTDERRCQGWDVSRDAAMEACGEAYEARRAA